MAGLATPKKLLAVGSFDSVYRKEKIAMKLENYGDVLTIDELCEILHIGKLKAYELLKTQVVKSLRIGKKFIIPKMGVVELLDSIAHQTNTELPEGERKIVIIQ